MEISNEDRKQILEGFIDIFTRISNKDYQKRVWIKGEGPEVDDFDDTVNDFFVESDSILENYKDFGIIESQYQLLKKFRDQFRAFSDENNWPQKFIDTPEWGKITEMAKEVLQAFDYRKEKKHYPYKDMISATEKCQTNKHGKFKRYIINTMILLKELARKAKLAADNPKEWF